MVGELGTSARLTLPFGHRVLGVSGEAVVSSELSSDERETVIHFGSRLGGSELHPPVSVPGDLFVGVVAGDVVLVTGTRIDGATDPGVYAASLADGSVVPVLPGGSAIDGDGPFVRNLAVSPSGRYAGSSVCSASGCTGGHVIDVLQGTTLASLAAKGGAAAMSDQVVVFRSGAEVTSELAAVDIASGDALWGLADRSYFHGYVTGEGEFVVLTQARAGLPLVMQAIRLDSGSVRELATLPATYEWALWPELSTDEVAVLGIGGPFPGSLEADQIARAAAVSVEDGSVDEEAVAVNLGP